MSQLSTFDAVVDEISRLGKPASCFRLVLSHQCSQELRICDYVALGHRFRAVVVTNALAGWQFMLLEQHHDTAACGYGI